MGATNVSPELVQRIAGMIQGQEAIRRSMAEPMDAHANVKNPNQFARLEYPRLMYPINGGHPVTARDKKHQAKLEEANYSARFPDGMTQTENGKLVASKQAQEAVDLKLANERAAFEKQLAEAKGRGQKAE